MKKNNNFYWLEEFEIQKFEVQSDFQILVFSSLSNNVIIQTQS